MEQKNSLYKKLEAQDARYQELEQSLSDPEVIKDKSQYQKLAKELSSITSAVQKFRQLKELEKQKQDLRRVLEEGCDSEFLQLAKTELSELEEKKEKIELEIKDLFRVEDKDADRDAMIEIRAGTGGKEAAIFAGDLYRMYAKYAANKNWKIEVMSSNSTELGGVKEIVLSVRGKQVYRRLKFESGVHRVQRVPETEASGRIHTSAATVAVLMEPEDVELVIDHKDLKIDVYRSSGKGGQHVNTTDSAVRITHMPTGIVVTCQDERSQLKNKNKAMRVLRARLLDDTERKKVSAQSQMRKTQVGSGDRSEKIRTYNFPDRRITDHRIGFTVHNLEQVLDGALDEITDALIKAEAQAKNE